MSDYNYGEFSTENYDFGSNEGPDVGELAPDFALTTVDGEARQLLDFDGDLLVLELGSITCPLFQSRRSGMEALAREFDDVDSAVLYVRGGFASGRRGTTQPPPERRSCRFRPATSRRCEASFGPRCPRWRTARWPTGVTGRGPTSIGVCSP